MPAAPPPGERRSAPPEGSAPLQVELAAPASALVRVEDVLESVRAEGVAAALLQAGEDFAESLDARQTLLTLARLVTAEFADACIITLLAEELTPPGGSRFEHVEVAARDPSAGDVLRELQQGSTSVADPASGISRVIRTSKAELFPLVAPMADLLHALSASAGEAELLSQLRPQSVMIVPLTARGWTFGAVTLLRHGPQPRPAFAPADLRLAQELCRRAAIAVDNARLFQLLERQREYQRVLAEAGTLLGSSLDCEAALRSVARAVVPELADYCAIDLLEDAGTLRRLSTAYAAAPLEGEAYEPGAASAQALDTPLGPAKVARSGRGELYPAITEELLTAFTGDRERLQVGGGPGEASAVVAPLAARGRTLGALTLVSATARRRYGPAELHHAEELARRVGLAIENARLWAAERAARAEAEKANRAKFDFLASMSHELRTPLNAIGGYAELLQEGVHGELTPPQRHTIERIARAGLHLLSLINDILNFSRIDAGKLDFDIAPVALGGLVQEVEILVAPQVRARSLRFDYAELDGTLTVRADAEKTRQILLNLISNAVKFTPEGGRVCVVGHAAGTRVHIEVQDTGIGIPPDKLEHIFEPFVQLGRTLSSGHQGTGLGLSISRDLARAMGGDIVARSIPGRGSTFQLTLPAA